MFDREKLKLTLKNVLQNFSDKLKTINVGTASIELINNIYVDAYGQNVKLNTVSQIIIEDATNVKITLWDKSLLQSVEKSLRNSDLGAGVSVDNSSIRLKYFSITGEKRIEKAKEVAKVAEEYKVRVRLVRQDFMKDIDSDKTISEDIIKNMKKDLQVDIDKSIDGIESLSKEKQGQITKL